MQKLYGCLFFPSPGARNLTHFLASSTNNDHTQVKQTSYR